MDKYVGLICLFIFCTFAKLAFATGEDDFDHISKLVNSREYEKAKEEIESVFKTNLDLSAADSAFLYLNLGISLHHLADHYGAIEILEKAIIYADLTNDQELKSLTRLELGRVYRYGLIDAKKSLKYFNETIGELPGGNMRLSATLDYELGMHAYIVGEIENIGLYGQSAMSKVRSFPEAVIYDLLSDLYKMMGIYHFMSGDNDNSRKSLMQGIILREKYEGKNAFELGRLYNNLGITYQFEQDLKTAAQYIHKGLKINNQFKYNWDRISNCHLNLGENMESRGVADSAIFYYRACLQNREIYFQPNSAEVFAAYFHLGNFYEGEGELDWAIHYNEMALTSILPGFRPEGISDLPKRVPMEFNMSFITAIRSRASILFSIYKDYPDSVVLFEQALSAFSRMDSLIQLTNGSTSFDKTRISYASAFHPHYESAIECAYEGYQKFGNRKYFLEALKFSERNKYNLLVDDIRNSVTSNIPESVLNKSDELRSQFSEVERRLANLKSAQDDQYDSLTKVLFKLSREQLELRKSIDEGNRLLTAELISGKDVSKIQYAGISSIEYFWGDSALYSFYLTKDSLIINRNTDLFEIEQEVKDWYGLLTLDRFSKIRDKENFKRFHTLGHSLYRKLIPHEYLNAAESILIIPDGILNKLPFEALVVDKSKREEVDYKNLDYLFKEHPVSYSYSLTYFSGIGSRPKNSHENVLVVSDESLPGSTLESQNISELMMGVTKWNGLKKDEFFAESPKYNVIHLALHGFLNEDNYLDGYIQLGKKKEDQLYIHDLFKLDLEADLAVLSACESGVGKFERGEGVYSFARGFAGAGVENVVFSLWRIDDQSTSRLVTSFYEHYKDDQDSRKALNSAKLDFLANADNITAFPGLWAGLVSVNSEPPFSSSNQRVILIGIALMIAFVFVMSFAAFRPKLVKSDEM